MAVAKDIIWEYTSSEFTMAQMNFHGKLGWEAFAFSPNHKSVYYKRIKKNG